MDAARESRELRCKRNNAESKQPNGTRNSSQGYVPAMTMRISNVPM